MIRRFTFVAAAIVVAHAVQVQADKLLLKDGRTVSGQVSIEKAETGRICMIVTDDGETLEI